MLHPVNGRTEEPFPSASSLLKQQGTFSSANEVALLSVPLAIMKNNKSSTTQHQVIVLLLVNLVHIVGISLSFSDIQSEAK